MPATIPRRADCSDPGLHPSEPGWRPGSQRVLVALNPERPSECRPPAGSWPALEQLATLKSRGASCFLRHRRTPREPEGRSQRPSLGTWSNSSCIFPCAHPAGCRAVAIINALARRSRLFAKPGSDPVPGSRLFYSAGDPTNRDALTIAGRSVRPSHAKCNGALIELAVYTCELAPPHYVRDRPSPAML